MNAPFVRGASLHTTICQPAGTEDARILRQSLIDLKGWIAHWQDDVTSGYPCTPSSLILAQAHVENALTVLDRMQAEHKDAA